MKLGIMCSFWNLLFINCVCASRRRREELQLSMSKNALMIAWNGVKRVCIKTGQLCRLDFCLVSQLLSRMLGTQSAWTPDSIENCFGIDLYFTLRAPLTRSSLNALTISGVAVPVNIFIRFARSRLDSSYVRWVIMMWHLVEATWEDFSGNHAFLLYVECLEGNLSTLLHWEIGPLSISYDINSVNKLTVGT